MTRTASQPIGVFDSGLGGLTVVREIRKKLPKESVVYFGDLARLPYGIRSSKQIREYSVQNVRFLLKHKVKAIVVACNSSSSAAFSLLKSKFKLPIIDVIQPAIEEAVLCTQTKRVAIAATQATVESGAYESGLKRKLKGVLVSQIACPLFVPLVEADWVKKKESASIAKAYLGALHRKKIDTMILGCTHYPLLKNVIQKTVGRRVRLIDSAGPTVKKLASILDQNGLLYKPRRKGRLSLYVSDQPRNFKKIGEKFLGEKIRTIRVIPNR